MLLIQKRQIKDVYLYIRVSTDTQVDKGYGLAIQQEQLLAYCKQHKLHVKGTYIDKGVSGTTIINERDGLNELTKVLQQDDVVLVLNTSRLWRDDAAKVDITKFFRRKLVHIKSLEQDSYDLFKDDPNEIFLNTVMEAMDTLDRSLVARKLAHGRKQKSKEGVKGCGKTPLGYKWKKEGESKPEVVIDEQEKEIVEMIFRTYMQYKSIGKVKRVLEQAGYVSRNGRAFADSSIRDILRNRFYIGEIVWTPHNEKRAGITHVYQGKHEPIISKVVFGKVQAELSRKKRGGRPKTIHELVPKEVEQARKEKDAFIKQKEEEMKQMIQLTEDNMRQSGTPEAFIHATLAAMKENLHKQAQKEAARLFNVQ